MEGDIAPVRADGRKNAVTVALVAAVILAGQGSGTGLTDTDKYLIITIGTWGYKVGGIGVEGDITPVGADARIKAPTVALVAAVILADQGGGTGLPVTCKYLWVSIGSWGHKVAGIGVEGDIAPVTADAGIKAVTVALSAVGGDADPLHAYNS